MRSVLKQLRHTFTSGGVAPGALCETASIKKKKAGAGSMSLILWCRKQLEVSFKHSGKFLGRRSKFDMAPSVSLIEYKTMKMLPRKLVNFLSRGNADFGGPWYTEHVWFS